MANMAPRQSIQLGQVQESLLVPLYGRALDASGKHPILNDRKAVEMVEAIDWDFQRFGQRRRIVACTLRMRAVFHVLAALFPDRAKGYYRLNLFAGPLEVART